MKLNMTQDAHKDISRPSFHVLDFEDALSDVFSLSCKVLVYECYLNMAFRYSIVVIYTYLYA